LSPDFFKIELHAYCYQLAKQKVAELSCVLKEVQDAANNETKSSAGDKHETGRAMAQLETEKLTNQLREALKVENVFNQLNPKLVSKQVVLGSLVLTNKGSFYISTSLGKITIREKSIYVVSPASPIGKLLLTKKEKDSFSFNGVDYHIIQIS
jgi:transcription elongation GreA/GreB family factor